MYPVAQWPAAAGRSANQRAARARLSSDSAPDQGGPSSGAGRRRSTRPPDTPAGDAARQPTQVPWENGGGGGGGGGEAAAPADCSPRRRPSSLRALIGVWQAGCRLWPRCPQTMWRVAEVSALAAAYFGSRSAPAQSVPLAARDRRDLKAFEATRRAAVSRRVPENCSSVYFGKRVRCAPNAVCMVFGSSWHIR